MGDLPLAIPPIAPPPTTPPRPGRRLLRLPTTITTTTAVAVVRPVPGLDPAAATPEGSLHSRRRGREPPDEHAHRSGRSSSRV